MIIFILIELNLHSNKSKIIGCYVSRADAMIARNQYINHPLKFVYSFTQEKLLDNHHAYYVEEHEIEV